MFFQLVVRGGIARKLSAARLHLVQQQQQRAGPSSLLLLFECQHDVITMMLIYRKASLFSGAI
jgi:hypothetical protein